MNQSLAHHAVAHEISIMPESSPLELGALLPTQTTNLLMRMFRDPSVLENEERLELIGQLRTAKALEPDVPELRVVLGMALCVNFEAQEALEELRDAVNMAPDNFLARLKFGELLMRLRVCDQAAEETHAAAKLARNPIQSELARKQAAVIRGLRREGIERGGNSKIVSAFEWLFGLFSRAEKNETSTALISR
jgi:hypothetical protein